MKAVHIQDILKGVDEKLIKGDRNTIIKKYDSKVIVIDIIDQFKKIEGQFTLIQIKKVI